ncbi:hypothetical protein MKJ04_14820 [Pontibacter sp. E15-1]|uniref:hypothetical protein n=1 Tax=Pontibacter sp. E15-1 TaxID=2919918 RepID=UPI001F4F7602|nr:hypothetical protein [Pontibacter sp. E15-1]MCJ8166117.1 hypothetical protein [Pontibacter sp. E15-1]
MKEPIITKSLTNKITRMILRTMPIIPGPELYDLFIELKDGKKTINSKIEQAYKALKETSNLVADLESDLIERTEKVKELKETYEEYSKLAEIEEDKIQPLISQLEKTVGKSRNVERVVSFFINLIAGLLLFIIGIWAGPTVKDWIWPKEKIEQMENIQGLKENVKPKIENSQPSPTDK